VYKPDFLGSNLLYNMNTITRILYNMCCKRYRPFHLNLNNTEIVLMIFIYSRLQMLWMAQIPEGATMGECVCLSFGSSNRANEYITAQLILGDLM